MYLNVGLVKSVNIDNCTVEVSTFDGAIIPNVQVSSPYFDPTTGGGIHHIPTIKSMCIFSKIRDDYYTIAFVGPGSPRKIPDKANFDIFKSYISDSELDSKNDPDEDNKLPGFRSNRQISNWQPGDVGLVATNSVDSKILLKSDGLITLWASPMCNIVLDPSSSNLASITTRNINWNMGDILFKTSTDEDNQKSLLSMEFNTPEGVNKGSLLLDVSSDGAEFYLTLNDNKTTIKHFKDGSFEFKTAEDMTIESKGKISINAERNIVLCGGSLIIKRR